MKQEEDIIIYENGSRHAKENRHPNFENQNHFQLEKRVKEIIHTKKTYDDISFEKRQQLISLINEKKWTIKSAARGLGIKLCTAKYILYQYRKRGRISRKNSRNECCSHSIKSSSEPETRVLLLPYFFYYPVPIPVCSEAEGCINLQTQQKE